MLSSLHKSLVSYPCPNLIGRWTETKNLPVRLQTPHSLCHFTGLCFRLISRGEEKAEKSACTLPLLSKHMLWLPFHQSPPLALPWPKWGDTAGEAAEKGVPGQGPGSHYPWTGWRPGRVQQWEQTQLSKQTRNVPCRKGNPSFSTEKENA